MSALAQLLSRSETRIAARARELAAERGILWPETLARMPWDSTVAGFSTALRQVIPGGLAGLDAAPKPDAPEGFAAPLDALAVREALAHRHRGVEMSRFLSICSCFRQAYLELVPEACPGAPGRAQADTLVNRFFDRFMAAAAVEWCGADEPERLGELCGRLREASALNHLTELLNQPGHEPEELLARLADELPACWDTPMQPLALIGYDGREYPSHGGQSAPHAAGAKLEEPLRVRGATSGFIRVTAAAPAQGFQSGERAMLADLARQVERMLETRTTLALLTQSERQFREFFDNAADALFIHDETGRILDANRTAGLWLNQPAGSLGGTSLLESLAEADREGAAAHFKNALSGTPELFQATVQRRDGFAIPAELLCQGQQFQGSPALITTGRNITSRLRDQAEIERRLEMEALVGGVSARLINCPETGMPGAIEESLDELCGFLSMPRAGVFLLDPTGKKLVLAHQRRVDGGPLLPPELRTLTRAKMPWFMERITNGERVFIRDAEHMPPAGRKEKALLTARGIASLAAVPMTVEERLVGVLAVASDLPQDTARLAGSRVLDQVTLLLANAIDRRDAARALRDSESLSRGILNALKDNICVLDKCGQLTMVNSAWGETGPQSTPLGDTAGRLGVGGKYLEALRQAQDNPNAAAALEGLQAVLSGRAKSFNAEYPVALATEQRWYVMQATPLGRARAGAVVSHRDVTERMRAVIEMRASEERFRIIVETAQEAILKIDAASAITYANPRAEQLFGYDAGELFGKYMNDILDEQDRELVRQKLKRRRLGLSDQYELRFRHKKGHRIWTVINASPLFDPTGAFAGSIALITDISDRVRAEAHLRRNEARYRSLVESMHEGLVMARRGGVVSYVNERFCAMLGRSRAEITGHPAADFAEAKSRERLAEMLGGTAHSAGAQEIIWEHASGRHIYSLVSPSAMVDDEGRTTGHFAVITDTTERKDLESQLLHSQKLEAIGQLAAGIAHEINTPAQYVGNNVQFIKGAFEDIFEVLQSMRALLERSKTACPGPEELEGLAKLVEERDIEYLANEVPGAITQTMEGVDRISVIVRSVKQFAHPGTTAMAPADLNESMKSTVTVSRNEWKYVAELDLDLDPAMPLVVCMIGELNQVVLNLIINAAHAIADAKKADPAREGRITLSTRLAPPWAEIRVSDTGTGIPPSVQAKIFDPFFTTKEVGRGTGQGLTISRTIVVEKHKGQLFFETKEGAGTTFVVRLPLQQQEA